MRCQNVQKRPIRRLDLTKHIFKGMDNIGSNVRVFHGAFMRAQTMFRTVYGMEIKEINRRVKPTAKTATQRSNLSVPTSNTMSASQAGGGTREKATKAHYLKKFDRWIKIKLLK